MPIRTTNITNEYKRTHLILCALICVVRHDPRYRPDLAASPKSNNNGRSCDQVFSSSSKAFEISEKCLLSGRRLSQLGWANSQASWNHMPFSYRRSSWSPVRLPNPSFEARSFLQCDLMGYALGSIYQCLFQLCINPILLSQLRCSPNLMHSLSHNQTQIWIRSIHFGGNRFIRLFFRNPSA